MKTRNSSVPLLVASLVFGILVCVAPWTSPAQAKTWVFEDCEGDPGDGLEGTLDDVADGGSNSVVKPVSSSIMEPETKDSVVIWIDRIGAVMIPIEVHADQYVMNTWRASQ